MADEQKGVVAAGFGLLWRRQGVLWWVFIVNLVCGGLGTMPAMTQLRAALGHSLAGQKLSRGFDVPMFFELVRLPNVSLMRSTTISYAFALLFFLFMLFVTGGILETYRLDRKLNTGEFFAASGAFFWRFVRLLLLSIIPFVIVGMIYQGLDKLADHVGDRAIADQVGIFLSWGAILVFMVLALWVRLWFDLAQVRAVVQSERGMWRNLWKSWRITWGAGLYWKYVLIALLAWITLAICLAVWTQVPPTAPLLTFLILQLIIFSQLASRLWQLASAMSWYQRHPELLPVPEAIEVEPVLMETTPAPEVPPADPGPELPPADA